MTLSRLSPEKGIERLLAALPFLPANVRIWICGAPAYMKGERYAHKLRQLADERVEFLGHVTGERKAALTMAFLCTAAMGTFVSQGLLYPALPLYLHKELGTVDGLPPFLRDHAIDHAIQVLNFYRAQPDDCIRRALKLTTSDALFGRQAILSDSIGPAFSSTRTNGRNESRIAI